MFMTDDERKVWLENYTMNENGSFVLNEGTDKKEMDKTLIKPIAAYSLILQEYGQRRNGDLLLKIAAGPKRTLVLAWLMSVIMFVDEYLNALTVTFSMREITDKNRIPREHLALQANIMACCLCMTIPFSSWTAFSVGWCRSTVWAFRTICGPSRTCSIRWP